MTHTFWARSSWTASSIWHVRVQGLILRPTDQDWLRGDHEVNKIVVDFQLFGFCRFSWSLRIVQDLFLLNLFSKCSLHMLPLFPGKEYKMPTLSSTHNCSCLILDGLTPATISRLKPSFLDLQETSSNIMRRFPSNCANGVCDGLPFAFNHECPCKTVKWHLHLNKKETDTASEYLPKTLRCHERRLLQRMLRRHKGPGIPRQDWRS